MILGTFIQGNPADNLIDRMISRTMPTHYENDRVSGTLRWRAFATNTGLNTVSLPNMTSIGYGCFMNCTGLKSVYMPNCTYVSAYVFKGCTNLTSLDIDWDNMVGVGEYAFTPCAKLPISITCAGATIPSHAFQSCSSMTYASFLNATTVSQNAFTQCSVQTIYCPNIVTVYQEAFKQASSVTSITMPGFGGTLSTRLFESCIKCSQYYLPKAVATGTLTFGTNTALTSITLERCSNVAQSCFRGCTNLATVCMSWLTSTGQVASDGFTNCYNLLSLYLLGSTMATLANANAFNSTPISTYTTSTGGVNGSIYVPSSLYASYIAATNWATYSARFVSMTDIEISAITGSWVSNMTASISYPASKPVYTTDDMKSYVSNVIVSYQNGTTETLDEEDYTIAMPSRDWGGRALAVINDKWRTVYYCVMAREYELPEEYERVGYLQAGGSDVAYINTELLPESTDTYIAVAQIDNTGNNTVNYFIYTNNSGLRRNANLWELYINGSRHQYSYDTTYGNSGSTISTQQNAVFTNYPYAVARISLTQTVTVTPTTNPYYIFAQNNNGTAVQGSTGSFRIWYIEIPNRLQLIPCKRKSDNVLGMYDLKGNICSLTNTPFFINAGTGSFTYGYNP